MLSKTVLVVGALFYVLVATAAVPKAENADWWKTAVFYQIYPRSFKDDNNDGIGDLQGIITKLPHLKDAGITAAWLSPIYKSPQVDQGYDISDFKDIDPSYGTLEDFDLLVNKSGELGIKIVMDFVPNHSSNEHEWFIKSEQNDATYIDYYIWRDCVETPFTPPNNWLSIFKYSAWKYSSKRNQCYYHQFAEAQPDLNYRNPLVVAEMKDVLKFWLDRGVAGFRMDAVPYLFEDELLRNEPPSNNAEAPAYEHDSLKHIYTSDLDETFGMIYDWRKYIDDYSEQHGGDARIMMTEAYTDIINTMYYYGNREEEGAHFTFNFQFITKVNQDSNAKDFVTAIKEWNDNMPSGYISNWVLGNHDNPRVATRFGPENVDGFNMLTALLPGILVTYNGEEIGQENGEVTWAQGQDPNACNGNASDFDKVSRDFERTPFHWDNSTNAGFSVVNTTWLPVSSKYPETNLKAQTNPDELSHYQIYKQLIALRKESTLINGELEIKALSDNVLAYTRTLEGSDTYVFVFNMGSNAETVNLVKEFPGMSPSLKIILPSGQSQYKKDDLLSTQSLSLQAHESIIAVTSSEVTESTTPEVTESTTPEVTESTTPGVIEATTAGSTNVPVTITALFIGLICSICF